MKVTIDRIEGKMAVVELEDGTTADLPLILVPNAQEGMTVNITVESDGMEERKKHIRSLMNDLFE
ncbi:MAG: DUF3006 domain-containing protein [Acutalibacteraceae bacterium]